MQSYLNQMQRWRFPPKLGRVLSPSDGGPVTPEAADYCFGGGVGRFLNNSGYT